MKFGTARGITRSRIPLLALMALSAAGIAGCAGEGSDGGSGVAGPTGPTGPTTGNGTIAISEADTVITTITNATVGSDNKVTVTFTLQDSQSRGLAGLQAANVRFTVSADAGRDADILVFRRGIFVGPANLGPANEEFTLDLEAGDDVPHNRDGVDRASNGDSA